MKTHRELLDNYHEAAWALAMEQVAIRQGEAAKELEERLNSDPAAAVPAHTIERCRAAIRRAFGSVRTRRARSVLSRILIAAVLCGVMTSAACAFSPSFREFLVRVFYSVADTFTAITFQNPHVEDVGAIQANTVYTNHGLRFEWIPEGYAYADGSESPRTRRVDFENAQSGYIRVQVISQNDSSTYNYDSESGAATQVAVGRFEGTLVEEEGQRTLFWLDEPQDKFILIAASDLSQEYLLQFAKGLVY